MGAEALQRTAADQASRRPVRAKGFPADALMRKSGLSVDSDSNWLITLSDLFCLLLICFVMMSLMTKNRVKPTTPKDGREAALPSVVAVVPTAAPVSGEKMREEMATALRGYDLTGDVTVENAGQEIIITVREKVSFKPGQAEVLKGTEPILDHIAGVIARYPSCLVDIEGHTDDIPIRTSRYPSNWELSVARAGAVLKYFITVHGLDPSRLSIKGNAEQRPAVPNDGPENRALNRRVEIRLKERGA